MLGDEARSSKEKSWPVPHETVMRASFVDDVENIAA